MSHYRKPALSIDDQIKLLVQRGMSVPDIASAKRYLNHINYYRLRAYWMPYETNHASGNHQFQKGTNFDDVIALYNFDREIRVLLIDAIERIEISLRTCLAHTLAIKYGAFVHEEAAHFKKQAIWQSCMDELKKEYVRSRETFADHHRNSYKQLNTPPIWVACELMTLGHISRWLQNLNLPSDRQLIANYYGLDEKILVSFAHHLTIVRNHCAHHGRVWNRRFSLKMQLPSKKPAHLMAVFNTSADRLLYNTLTMLAYMLQQICPDVTWSSRAKMLMLSCPQANLAVMGFPANWQQRAFWNIQ